MKILKNGSIKDIEQCKFECKKCGCIFEADEHDTVDLVFLRNEFYRTCICPCCKNRVYKEEL